MVSTCPSRYVSPPLSPSSTPSPTFLALAAVAAAAAANDGTHVRDPSRTRRTRGRCVFSLSAGGGPGRMLHCAQPLLHVPPIPPTPASSYHHHLPPPFLCTPLQPLRASPPCNPPRRRLLLFPFFQFGVGGGKRATPSPLLALRTPPPLLSATHEAPLPPPSSRLSLPR